MAKNKQPNFLILWGDDIGQSNLSIFTKGMMGYRTPNIDRIAKEGMMFTDYYAEQSCTAGRASFITGQCGLRTGLTKVGLPGAALGLQAEDPTIAELLKPLGYRTGPVRQEPPRRPRRAPADDARLRRVLRQPVPPERRGGTRGTPTIRTRRTSPSFSKKFGPRGVLHCWADGKGGQKIENTGPLTKKRMETCDDEFLAAAKKFIKKAHDAGKPFFVWFNTSHMHFRTHIEAGEPRPGGTLAVRVSRLMIDHDKHIGEMLALARRARHRRQHDRACTAPTTGRT